MKRRLGLRSHKEASMAEDEGKVEVPVPNCIGQIHKKFNLWCSAQCPATALCSIKTLKDAIKRAEERREKEEGEQGQP